MSLTFLVLVCGGRAYGTKMEPVSGSTFMTKLSSKADAEKQVLKATLDELHLRNRFTHLMHGGAPGADTLADRWAELAGVQTVACRANWNRYDKAAGYVRNKAMIALDPDLVIAFPGGRGTANMVQIAKQYGIPVHEVLIGS